MAQTIQLKRSATAGNIPTSSDLALGEIAINTADGAVYIKKGNNDIVAVADNDILHIDTTNSRVGIGTTNPQTALHVEGITRITESSNTAFYGGDYVRVFGNQYFNFRNTGGSTIARIHMNGNSYFNGGNVGIGTASPATNLEISGSAPKLRITDTRDQTFTVGDIMSSIEFDSDDTSGGAGTSSEPRAAINMYAASTFGSSTGLEFRTKGDTTGYPVQRMIIDSSGNVGIGTSSPDTLLHVDNATDPTIRVEDTDSGMKVDLQSNGSTGFVGTTTNSHFAIRSNNTERIKVLNTGAVSFNGAYSFPTSDGSANQVLQTDGSGNLSFGTAAGGGGVTISNNVNNRVLTGDGTNANAEANLTFDGSTLDVTGNVIIDTSPAATYGVSEALRIDNTGATTDRQLQFFELCNAGARSHRLAYNTNITTTGSAYTHTQGLYGGSSQIEFGNSGAMIFYVNEQGTGGSTTAITPTERFRLESDGKAKFTGDVHLEDTKGVYLGASNDLQLYHNGSNSLISNQNGDLYIRQQTDDGDIIFQADDGVGGDTEYFRFDGGNVQMIASQKIAFNDNVRATFGASSDLQIYHDGSNSYIEDSGTGNLKIRTNSLNVMNAANSEAMINANENGAVTLYYDNAAKLATKSDGVDITGELQADSLDIDGNGEISGLLTINSSTDGKLKLKTPSGEGTDWNYIEFLGADGVRDGYVGTDADGDMKFFSDKNSSELRLESTGATIAANLTVAGTINSGAITSTGEVEATALDINGNGDISGNLTLGGYLAGPATFTIDPAAVGDNTGTVVIAGNLQVDGTTTTINSTTLTVDDKLITLASGSINAAAADGAGIEVDITGSTNPSITYDGTNDEWDFNKNINITGSVKIDNGASFTAYEVYRDNILYGRVGGGSNQFTIQASNNKNVNIFADSGTGLTVKDGGNVGIGTTNPTQKLTLSNGTFQINGSSSFSSNVEIGRVGSDNNMGFATGGTERMRITTGGNVGIGTTSPSSYYAKKLVVSAANEEGITIAATQDQATNYLLFADGTSGDAQYRGQIAYAHSSDNLDLVSTGTMTFKSGSSRLERMRIDSSGNVGIGTTAPATKLQVEEYGIDTTETSTTATTQVAIHTFAAATFRSARFTVQVTNSTDSTYHLTEILMIHDGTTPSITEYGTIFTGSAAEATFDADINTGNVRLLATPASTDAMEFKVVSHSITT